MIVAMFENRALSWNSELAGGEGEEGLIERLGLHTVVMIADVHISQEIFAIDMLTALKPSLDHDRQLVLQLLRLYGDQA